MTDVILVIDIRYGATLRQSTVFRHDIIHHGDCFRAVAVLTQLEIDNGARLFDVAYTDDYFELITLDPEMVGT